MKKNLKLLCLLFSLVLLLGAVACDGSDIETESDTIAATESMTESATESLTESATATETETMTETQTKTDTVTETESATETETQTETETEHIHDWTEASCLVPKTCNECGETEGEPLGHSGGQATCLGRAKCDVCGKVYGEVAKHDYSGQITTTEYLATPATTARPATYYYSCIYCGGATSKRFAYGGTILENLETNYNCYFTEGNDGEGYLYFTDPHPVNCDAIASFWSGREAQFEILSKLYGSSKATFTICGGDWFNNSNSKESAIAMQQFIREKTTEWFDKCYLVLGNHDYNYQYVSGGTNGMSPHKLTEEEIAASWFSEYGKTYYTFSTDVSRYYVFNSGIDWSHGSLTDLDKEQIVWYLEELTANDDKHIVLCPHMIHTSAQNLNPGTKAFAEISRIYNERGTYTYAGVTYDFSGKTGMVEYIIAGHNHAAASGDVEGIPYVTVPSFTASTEPPTADFVYADYTARKLYLYRVGSGVSREIDLLPLE